MSQILGPSSDAPTCSIPSFKWEYLNTLPPNSPHKLRAEIFLSHVDWTSLINHASNQHEGVKCKLLPDVGLGGNHLVRVLQFEDGTRWVARLRLPSLAEKADIPNVFDTGTMRREINTMMLVRNASKVPVPRIHGFELDHDNAVRSPFMLMDCLDGNVGMDLGMDVPEMHQPLFYRALADIHNSLWKIKLPQIGIIEAMDESGMIRQGPIPGLGGPFDTAAEYFRAWAAQAKFGLPVDNLRQSCGPYFDEILSAIESFPARIVEIADRLSISNTGPFPLCHGDFGHNNIIVDDDYQVLGVIDWETAFAAPVEVAGDFPLTLSTTPWRLDPPWLYDDRGVPKDADLAAKMQSQQDYIATVAVMESEDCGKDGTKLSTVLQRSDTRSVITAMRLYERGKAGFYSKLFE